MVAIDQRLSEESADVGGPAGERSRKSSLWLATLFLSSGRRARGLEVERKFEPRVLRGPAVIGWRRSDRWPTWAGRPAREPLAGGGAINSAPTDRNQSQQPVAPPAPSLRRRRPASSSLTAAAAVGRRVGWPTNDRPTDHWLAGRALRPSASWRPGGAKCEMRNAKCEMRNARSEMPDPRSQVRGPRLLLEGRERRHDCAFVPAEAAPACHSAPLAAAATLAKCLPLATFLLLALFGARPSLHSALRSRGLRRSAFGSAGEGAAAAE